MENLNPMLVLQIMVILVIIIIFFYILKISRTYRLSRRIGIYSVESLSSTPISLFDRAFNTYKDIIKRISVVISKSKFIDKICNRYTKYIGYMDDISELDIISNKFIVIFILIILLFLANAVLFQYPNLFDILITIGIGYIIPDIFVRYKSYMNHRRIEKDMLNAIIMLNNAFKSGRSTMQAIAIVKDELDGPIKKEFERMHTEIMYGLSFDSVFKRFADRVKIEEINYITSSLAVLNRTGGNIVKVFSSIEKSLYNRKRLESEMKALTEAAKAMSNILLVLPFVFAGIIMLFNPDYFTSLFDNIVGLSVFFIIIIFYVIYVVIVKKVLKVRMWENAIKAEFRMVYFP